MVTVTAVTIIDDDTMTHNRSQQSNEHERSPLRQLIAGARGLRLGCALILVLALLSMSRPAAGDEPPLNEWCPVMTDERVDPEISIIYQGKKIGLCCDMCVKKFKANPDKYLPRLPQFADSAASPSDPTTTQSGQDGDKLGTGASDELGLPVRAADPVALSTEDRDPWLGRLHPIAVHFPLAGIPLAFLAFLVWVWTGRDAFAQAEVVPLIVATLASIAAVITGNIAHDAMRFSESMRIIAEQHQLASTALMILAIVLSAFRIWRWNRLVGTWRCAYGCGLLAACALGGYTGFLGGSLVFGPDHLQW